jgi:hypothetical protein
MKRKGISSLYVCNKNISNQRKLADKRAAIAFNYGGSELTRSSDNKDWKERRVNDLSSSDDEFDEPEDMGLFLL